MSCHSFNVCSECAARFCDQQTDSSDEYQNLECTQSSPESSNVCDDILPQPKNVEQPQVAAKVTRPSRNELQCPPTTNSEKLTVPKILPKPQSLSAAQQSITGKETQISKPGSKAVETVSKPLSQSQQGEVKENSSAPKSIGTKLKKISLLKCPPNPCESLERARAESEAKRRISVAKRATLTSKKQPPLKTITKSQLKVLPSQELSTGQIKKFNSQASNIGKSAERSVTPKASTQSRRPQTPDTAERSLTSNSFKQSLTVKSSQQSVKSKAIVSNKESGEPQTIDDVKYSSKYLKMKYEVDLQNYCVAKMSRDLAVKKMKCRPRCELRLLEKRLNKEVNKLNEMVKFAICVQRKNKHEKWGPIQISPLSEAQSKLCPPKSRHNVKPPVTPSGISKVSGFEELDEIMMDKDEEACKMKIELKEKQKKIHEMCQRLKTMECQLQKFEEQKQSEKSQQNHESAAKEYEIKCEELFNLSSDGTDDELDKNVRIKLKSAERLMEELVANVEVMKGSVAKIRQEMFALKEN